MGIENISEMCHEYNKSYDTNCDLSSSGFENYLGSSAPYRHIIQSLTSKNISLRIDSTSIYQGTESEERKFELATLRIISGAVLVFYDPWSFGFRGVDAGLTNLATPNVAIQNASKKLLNQINKQELYVGKQFYAGLERMANGWPVLMMPQFSENKDAKIKMLVREVALLSKKLFIITNDKACRFPAQALLRIFDLVKVPVSEKTIQRHQKEYDDSKDAPLSLQRSQRQLRTD